MDYRDMVVNNIADSLECERDAAQDMVDKLLFVGLPEIRNVLSHSDDIGNAIRLFDDNGKEYLAYYDETFHIYAVKEQGAGKYMYAEYC